MAKIVWAWSLLFCETQVPANALWKDYVKCSQDFRCSVKHNEIDEKSLLLLERKDLILVVKFVILPCRCYLCLFYEASGYQNIQ